MDDPSKVMVAFGVLGTFVISITVIARAAVAMRKGAPRLEREGAPSVTDARLARIEQAVEAIAIEVERISEGQRFTTKLLSEQTRPAPKPLQKQISGNTPI
mgnify:CR=1 FL=1